MPVELPYLGETVAKALIEAGFSRFLEEACIPMLPDEKLVAVHHNAPFAKFQDTRFDGASTIDLLIQTSHRNIAVEVKLGKTRLKAARFKGDFLRDPERSRHKPPRWNGNVIGFLERRFASRDGEPLAASVQDRRLPLELQWVLVVRKEVADGWGSTIEEARRHLGLSDNAHVVAIETIVARFGTPVEFNEMVSGLLSFDYHSVWAL
ncbi:hypothetical protein ACXR0O_14030 [Verrucomicrobiota bacterium sgz303538]